ncbi:hypothetical protein ACHAXR_012136 [Thalassiosira sp. AJA248-18]
MKLHTTLTSLFATSAAFVAYAQTTPPTYPCPAAGSSTILPITPSSSTTTIRIPIISNPNGLCILLRHSSIDGTKRAHVARSYAGNAWELSPGPFTKRDSGANVDCDGGDEYECDVVLPGLLDDEHQQEYVLESYEYSTSAEAEASRFLEQATFGPTLQDINSLTSSGNDFESWVHDQIYNTPRSSLRKFYREHTNPKFEFPYNTGAVSSFPCQLYSRWRTYAITSRDCLQERKTLRQKHLTITNVSGVGYVFYVDGYIRTVVSSRPRHGWGGGNGEYFKLNYKYRIGSTNGANWRSDCVGCAVPLFDYDYPTGRFDKDGNPKYGKVFYLNNPAVNIPQDIPSSILSWSIVPLPSLNSQSFPSMDDGENYGSFATWIHPNENGLLNTTELEDTNACDGFPNYHQPIPYDGGSAGKLGPIGTFPTVFGATPEGIQFAYDPHLALRENTVENPLPDGGGQLVIETDGLRPGSDSPGEQVMCQNVERNFLNEDGCRVSYDTSTCTPGEYPTPVIELSIENIEGMRNMLGKDIYVLKDVDMSSLVLDSSTGKDAPCGDGEQRSRWVMVEDTTCENSAGLDEKTIHLFRSLIDARSEESLNSANIVDAKKHMHGMQCAVSDKMKVTLGSIQASDGSCWRHVHSNELSVVDFSSLDTQAEPTGPATSYEGEDAILAWGTKIGTGNDGFFGSGYANFGGQDSYAEFNVDAGNGGLCILTFRYAQGTSDTRPCSITVNGALVGELSFVKTTTWSDWQEETIITTCSNANNAIRLTAKDNSGGPNVDRMTYQAGIIDESTSIDQYILPGSLYVTLPSSWTDLHVLGKFGDYVQLDGSSSPPTPLNDASVQESFKSLIYNPLAGPVLVCGSPDEVSSNPFNGDQGFDIVIPESEGFRSMSIWELSAQRHTVWTHLALKTADQLRMRVAWALSQIVAVGLAGSGMVFFEPTEQYISFYDIFTRHAFGNYRDIMKEFSFNKVMAEWLSFKENKSLQYNLDQGEEQYPDENFAREIMQLFSIGLYQLNQDGTKVLIDGKPTETYTISDIVSYSKAWTGFEGRYKRGGTSTSGRHGDNTLDPMKINGELRDLFPKSDLHGGFIGDQAVPLCTDLPSKHFTRKGATYKILGSSPKPELQGYSNAWGPETKRLDLSTSSPLFDKLCSPSPSGDCTFPSIIVLDENLIYDNAAKMGDEYAVDTIRTVGIKVGPIPIYYEYVRQPCVEHSYYNNAIKLMMGQIYSGGQQLDPAICGDPRLPIGTPMCCETSSELGYVYCNYQGERVTYESAQAFCAANGKESCQPGLMKENLSGQCALGSMGRHFRSWASVGCELKVKINTETGDVAIVHAPEPDFAGQTSVESMVDNDTLNYFKTPWKTGYYPSLSDCLALPSCVIHFDDSCICTTEVTDQQVFVSAIEVSSINGLMASLHTGAVDPDTFDAGTYNSLGSCGIAGASIYSTSGDCTTLKGDTIFAIEVMSKQYFLKNSNSLVHIAGSESFSFRNPVHFTSLADPEIRDMYHETDAVIDSLFYHPSHPPFLATLLSQRFGISNPSPAFIERAVVAYTAGAYKGIGSNKYGDLGALISAILLDDEARSIVLDQDQTHGQLKEPLLKVMSFFRSMGISFNSPLRIPTLLSLYSDIGQGSFESPSVFSFFLPEFQPNSQALQSAGLVAPESMVLQGDNVLTLLDSMYNTIKFGVTDTGLCEDHAPSFEGWRNGVGDFGFKLQLPHGANCASTEGDTSLSPAAISYEPSSTASVDDILDELVVLLTAGRLSESNRNLIKSVMNQYFSSDVGKAVRIAQQLLISTPEFHSTSIPRKLDSVREVTGYDTPPSTPYKALVVLVMSGGCDSFNLLVPKGQCESGDQYQEYKSARGSHAIAKDDLISITTTGQDCTEFGVNKKFKLLSDLYAEGEALFFANTGVLSKPMTKHDEWVKETSFQLFAHNTMLHEAATGDPYETNASTGIWGRVLDMLKQGGYQTSANGVAGSGETALTGDQYYSNPVYSVSDSPPGLMNKIPTIANLLELVKQLNGVGEGENSYLAETWSAKVASALFEYEQMQEMGANSNFEVTQSEYGKSGDLDARFRAIASHMRARDYRKVDRDIYIVSQKGYDLHSENTLNDLFSVGDKGNANGALTLFKQFLVEEELWDSTAILMASDFGRSLNPNSNGGTDHAWGGNYFLIGGKVNGGKILGDFPQPLSSENAHWIGRGRFIPTTPWDAVWNGIASWLGITSDADLDWILPNRGKFDNLFSGDDLFTNISNPPNPAPTNPSNPTNPPPTPTPNLLVIAGDDKVAYPGYTWPLQMCQGDCDNNGDCDDGLYCFQRSGLEAVPGCSGEENSVSRKDYCAALDPTPLPTPNPTNTNPPPTPPTSDAPTSSPTAEPSPAPTGPQPTNAPTTLSPTKAPVTAEPSPSPVKAPFTSEPSPSPTTHPTSLPTNLPVIPPTGSSVANVVGKSSTVTAFGCTTTSNNQATDAKTNPMACSITPGSGPLGVEITPFHKQLSKVHGIRVYSHKNYPIYDPVTYVVEGRADSGSPWQVVAQGDFEWISDSSPGRNPSGIVINSSYESGDSSRSFTEVTFPDNNAAYLDYKITFTTRQSSSSTLKFAELELPGLIQASMTTYEAEDQTVSGNKNIYTSSDGTTYVNRGFSYIEFAHVDAGPGGTCALSFSYSNGNSSDRPHDVMINGVTIGTLAFPPGGSWVDWKNEAIETMCAPGLNVVRISGSGANINSMTIYKSSPPGSPNISGSPSKAPDTVEPSKSPTKLPVQTLQPATAEPSTGEPTPLPTNVPSTSSPTKAPVTAGPSNSPTSQPTTVQPTTLEPITANPTPNPTAFPTTGPTKEPTTLEPATSNVSYL